MDDRDKDPAVVLPYLVGQAAGCQRGVRGVWLPKDQLRLRDLHPDLTKPAV